MAVICAAAAAAAAETFVPVSIQLHAVQILSFYRFVCITCKISSHYSEDN